MTRRGWVLFSLMSVIWGTPYLLIKVAVEEVSPPVVVAFRTALAALVLLPLAGARGALAPALARWRPLALFALVEMAVPWILLTDAERRLPSSLTGLLVATVPLIGTLIAFGLGDRGVLRPARLAGLALGLAGVALVVGLGQGGTIAVVPVIEVLLVAACYATGPFVATRYLIDVPGIGVVAIATGAVALVFLVPAIATAPERFPSGSVLAALVGLGVLCTAIAFTVFFSLIDEVGPVKASLITFVNPAVAITLGVLLLDEALTLGLVIGFPMVIAGCWLVSRHHAPTAELPVAAADGEPRSVTPITVD